MGVLEFITGIFGAIVGAIGGVLFYKQRKKSYEIENESKLAAEWEKLYREQKAVSDKNGAKIEELTNKVTELNIEVETLKHEREFVCMNFACCERKSPEQKKN